MDIDKYIKRYKSISPAIKAGIWFTICNFLQKGVSFITIPIFTRIMTTEEYGLYSVYTSWYSLITIFATLHLSYYVFNKGLVKYEEDRDRFVVSIQSLSATITLFLIGVYLIFRAHINQMLDMPTAMVLCMMLQILFEPPVLYWTARKRFEYKYQAVIIVTLAISILNPVLGIILIKLKCFSDAAISRVVSIVLISAIFGIWLALIIIKKGKCIYSVKYWKYALNFNLPLIPHYLSTTVLSSADRIMIKDMCSATYAAIYSVAYSTGMCCTLFSQAINQALLPWLYKKMKKEDYVGISAISNSVLIGMLGIVLLLTCFSPEIIRIVGSSEYQEAVWVMPPICGSIYFIFLQNLFANIEYYFEKTKLIAGASVIVAILNVLLNYIFIQKFGYVAAGYTTLFCYIMYAIVHYFVLKNICQKNKLELKKLFNMKIVFGISVIMLLMIFLMTVVYRNFVIRYLVIIVLLLGVVLFRKQILNILSTVKESQ